MDGNTIIVSLINYKRLNCKIIKQAIFTSQRNEFATG